MGKITTRQFQILTDINLVWDFFVDVYDREKGGGVAAPFFEYAVQSTWMDNTYSYLNRIWFDGDKVVAFVFNEAPATDVYFKVRPGYEFLADELVDYAICSMPDFDGKMQFMLFNGQEFLMNAAIRRGFKKLYDYEDCSFDFANQLDYQLPEGFHFVDPEECDVLKLAECLWYGFNHGEKGPFENWEKPSVEKTDWDPHKQYVCIKGPLTSPSPHSTHQYDIIIADENENYVCYSGMWWVPQNHLAYMEPLCTVPQHRGKGLASAALSRHYHRMKELGATHMTGGGDQFYTKIGYGKGIHWNCFGR